MDTGISTDSYAIIELGMVDDLIKDKENSPSQDAGAGRWYFHI